MALRMFSVVFVLGCLTVLSRESLSAIETIPVGVAKVDITPDQPVRMYGYASRKTESEGIAGRLKATAMALGGDDGEGPAILLTVDSGSVPAAIRDEVLHRVQKAVAVKPERFVLCNAHIHSGPDLKGMSSMTGAEREHLAQYAEELTQRLGQVVLDSLAARRPGRLDWTIGSVRFAANRRVLKDGKWKTFGAVPDAPVDHSLPLMRVSDDQGQLVAVVLNYACHNTTLRQDFRQIHGDWGGCAQQFIEAEHPGAVALVTIGCGADADPSPHDTIELCQQHGRAVADEVSRLLAVPFKPLSPQLAARTEELKMPYEPLPPLETLRQRIGKSRSAERIVKYLEGGGKPRTIEPYRITVWTFGDDLAMVFLSDEVVVDYARRLKRELDGSRLWITAYANDVSYYVASDRLIGEGGYEVDNSLSAMLSYGQPASVQPSVETRIIQGVRELVPAAFARPASTKPTR